MSEPLTEAKLTEALRELWATRDPHPTRILVSPATVRKLGAVAAFGQGLPWWRRAFYWAFRAKRSRDLRRYVAARVPEDTGGSRWPSGLDIFTSHEGSRHAQRQRRRRVLGVLLDRPARRVRDR